ncbi:MAG: hypothetical protein U0354_13815 [Candidatus Sericytochromatia bacterium]
MSSDNENNSKKAYITSDGRYIEEPVDEVQELKKPRQVSKKQESVIPKKKKSEKSEYENKRGKEFEKLDEQLDHDTDIFDEDGNIIEEESELRQKLKEIEEKVEKALNRVLEIIVQKVKKPFVKVKNKALSLASRLLNPFTRILGVVEKVLKRGKKEEPKVEVIEEPKVKKLAHGTFENMIELNVTLTDNYDAPLYKKRSIALAKTEESIILMGAKDAIKQCAEFTKGMEPIKSGYYEGRLVTDIMENVEDDDITLFLGYIKARPQKYVSKTWKMSETFATWLVNNAPMAEEQ